MATLFFCVFEGAGSVALGDPLQEAVISIGVSSTSSADPIVGEKRLRRKVRLYADANCFVTWGTTPDAQPDGSDGRPLAADGAEYFDIEAGYKIAVIER